MSELAKKKCVHWIVGAEPLKGDRLQTLFKQLEEGWKLIEEKRIEKIYKFKDFKEALGFVNDLGKIAEEEGHHPDIELSWGRVKVILWTHKIDGLTESDLVMAAKCDVAFTSRVR